MIRGFNNNTAHRCDRLQKMENVRGLLVYSFQTPEKTISAGPVIYT